MAGRAGSGMLTVPRVFGALIIAAARKGRTTDARTAAVVRSATKEGATAGAARDDRITVICPRVTSGSPPLIEGAKTPQRAPIVGVRSTK